MKKVLMFLIALSITPTAFTEEGSQTQQVIDTYNTQKSLSATQAAALVSATTAVDNYTKRISDTTTALLNIQTTFGAQAKADRLMELKSKLIDIQLEEESNRRKGITTPVTGNSGVIEGQITNLTNTMKEEMDTFVDNKVAQLKEFKKIEGADSRKINAEIRRIKKAKFDLGVYLFFNKNADPGKMANKLTNQDGTGFIDVLSNDDIMTDWVGTTKDETTRLMALRDDLDKKQIPIDEVSLIKSSIDAAVLNGKNTQLQFAFLMQDIGKLAGKMGISLIGRHTKVRRLKEALANDQSFIKQMSDSPMGIFVNGQISRAMGNICKEVNKCEAAANAEESVIDMFKFLDNSNRSLKKIELQEVPTEQDRYHDVHSG